MAMLDRLKDATRSTNSIEAVQPLAGPQRPLDLHGANPAGSPTAPAAAPPAAKKPAGDPKAPAYTTEPEAISRAYYVEDRGGERRYFDDYQRKSLAIRADDSTITTKKEDLNTIRAMLTMAEARGWSEVKVAGTADFKRESWIEAQARGITAQGHKASDLDRQEADRRRAERGQAPVQAGPKQDTNEIRTVAGPAVQAAAPQAAQTVTPAAAPQREAEPSRPAVDLHRANPLSPAAAPIPVPSADQVARNAIGKDAVGLMVRAQDAVLDYRKMRLEDQPPRPVAEFAAQARQQLSNAWQNANASKAMTAAGFSEKGMQRDLETGRFNALSTGLSVSGVPAREFDIKLIPLSVEPNRMLPSHSKEAAPVIGQNPAQPGTTLAVNHRQALKDATAELSPDGRLVLAALSEKIDRQMNKLNADAKLETKAFAAAELVKKEKLEGPVVLSPELRKLATAPEPAQVKQAPAPVPQPAVVRQVESQPPQRSRGR